jgi:8-oxo-dGTP pyrophosphatase MutT (NUDIX family)
MSYPPWLSDSADRWPVASTEVLAQGALVTLRRDTVRMPDGDDAKRDVVEHPGAVAVLALDDGGQVLLIGQYRHPVARRLWEIPAGLRDVPGEPLEKTARRELLEEAGYLAADWQVLADVFTSPGISSDLTQVPDAERDYVPQHEETQLTIRWAPMDSVIAAFLAGELHNGVAAIGVLAAYAARHGEFAGLRGTDAPER